MDSNSPEKNRVLSEQELEDLMERAVSRTLTKLGIDTDHPLEVQRDLQFVRDWRITTESLRGKTIVAAIGIVVAGAMGVFWLGLKAIMARL